MATTRIASDEIALKALEFELSDLRGRRDALNVRIAKIVANISTSALGNDALSIGADLARLSRNRRIAKARVSGQTYKKIAAQFGLTVNHVRSICVKIDYTLARGHYDTVDQLFDHFELGKKLWLAMRQRDASVAYIDVPVRSLGLRDVTRGTDAEHMLFNLVDRNGGIDTTLRQFVSKCSESDFVIMLTQFPKAAKLLRDLVAPFGLSLPKKTA